MKKLKNNLDEMQEISALKMGERSFWIMFIGLGIVIVVQICLYQENIFRYTAGETILFCIGGAYYTAAGVKNGIWDRKIPATRKANLIVSLVCSGIFAVIFGVANYIRYGMGKAALAAAGIFFIFVSVGCYVVLAAMLAVYKKRKEKLEGESEE